jgi:ABC-type glycerol-3-phosphate transport system substrate-binding protein
LIKQESNAKVDKFLFIAAVAALALAVSVWGFRQIAQSRRTVIVVSRSGENLFGAEAFGALVQEFEKHNPDLRIRLADDGADIVFFDDSEIGGLLAESALASLGPYIHSETEARQWALPLVSFTDIFLYNIDILQAADLDRPPKTRTELLAAARAIAEQEAVSPLALGLSEDDPLALRRELYPWIWAVGGELRQEARQNGGQNGGESVTLSRATTEAIAFFGQLNSEGLLAPGSFEKTRSQLLQEFAKGSVAMLMASSRDLPLLRNIAGAPHPRRDRGAALGPAAGVVYRYFSL